MPVYVYECDVCGKRFELHRHFGAPRPAVCPDGHDGVHRIFSAPAIIFKGSGFYATDNARNGRVIGAGSREKETTKAGEKESKTTTKEEAKE